MNQPFYMPSYFQTDDESGAPATGQSAPYSCVSAGHTGQAAVAPGPKPGSFGKSKGRVNL